MFSGNVHAGFLSVHAEKWTRPRTLQFADWEIVAVDDGSSALVASIMHNAVVPYLRPDDFCQEPLVTASGSEWRARESNAMDPA
jgi:hypothetical protein